MLSEVLFNPGASAMDEIFRGDIGIVFPSIRGWRNAAWIIRAPSSDVIDRLLPKDHRKEMDMGGGATLLRIDNGLVVGRRENVIIIARKNTDGRLFRAVLRLMGGREGDTVEKDVEFRKLDTYLPNRDIATIYVNSVGPPVPSPSKPLVDRFMLGIYQNEGRLELALRATLSSRLNIGPRLSDASLDRILGLPGTSMAAIAIHSPQIAGWERGADIGSLLFGTWVKAIFDALHAAANGSMERAEGSPQVVAVLDSEASSTGGTPRVAVSIESKTAQKLCLELEQALSAATSFAGGVAQGATKPQQATHLGHTLWYLPLCEKAAGISADDRLECALRLEPTWTTMGDWFVIASTRKHLEQMIDADLGVAPRLSSIPEARALRVRKTRHSGLAVVQPSLFTGLLDRWMHESEVSDSTDYFASVAWQLMSEGIVDRDPDRLGIGVQSPPRPGTVIVARVDAGSSADGKLQVGDRIIGAEGQLLRLDAANNDLRLRWDGIQPGESITLRVERRDTTLEVPVRKPFPTEADSNPVVIPTGVLTTLASLRSFAAGIASITVTLPSTDENHFSMFASIKAVSETPASAVGTRN